MGLLVCERRSELGTLGEFRKSPLMEMGRPALGSTCGELAAESCEAFCSGRCSFHPDYAPGKATNLTVYRLTAAKMLKYGVGNKDTGDAAGVMQ